MEESGTYLKSVVRLFTVINVVVITRGGDGIKARDSTIDVMR